MEYGLFNQYRDARYQAYARLQRWSLEREWVWKLSAAFFLAIATGLLAQIRVWTDLSPVPYTAQVFGVSLMGGLLGRKWGGMSAVLYLLLGIIGLPVFAGQMEAFRSFHLFSGWVVFQTELTAGYLVGFVLQAYIVGALVETRRTETRRPLVLTAALGTLGLLTLALIDVYFLATYRNLYPTSPVKFPNPVFLVIVLGLAVLLAGSAWAALTSKARRERIELLMANVLGLLALYAVGAAWFAVVWLMRSDAPELGVSGLLRYTVLPFIPADLTKILLAIGLLTLLRPTRKEIEARAPLEANRHV